MKHILVTGGCGFIGSHTCVELLENNYKITIVDNLINSNKNVIDKIKNITNKDLSFYELDLLHYTKLDNLFTLNNFDAVIHFAGVKAVGESITDPLYYYNNNIVSTLNLLQIMKIHKCYNFIFSSSSTVYGSSISPLNENSITGIGLTNPYSKTKYFIEKILEDLCISDNNFNITSLRYFNPVGAHKSGLIGESPNSIPNNLMPYLLKVALQNNTNKFIDNKFNYLSIFGDNYNTNDGSCIRDFIHVVDLAKGHIKALDKLCNYKVFNLGTGKGTSVLELIEKFKTINNVKLPIKIEERRNGDLEEVFCDVEIAHKELDWKCNLTLEDICKDSWNFQLNFNLV